MPALVIVLWEPVNIRERNGTKGRDRERKRQQYLFAVMSFWFFFPFTKALHYAIFKLSIHYNLSLSLCLHLLLLAKDLPLSIYPFIILNLVVLLCLPFSLSYIDRDPLASTAGAPMRPNPNSMDSNQFFIMLDK